LFLDPENHDYHLSFGSPCINTGDPVSPPDPDGSQADMGAYYFQQMNIEDCEITIPEVMGLQGDFFQLDIITSNVIADWEVTSFEFDLEFDESIINYLNFTQTGTISQGGDVIVETYTNLISVSCTTTEFLEGDGLLISLFFNPVLGGTSILEASDFYYNTTNISNITNGSAIILGQSSDPIPENNATAVETEHILYWTNGENTETIDLYFGTENPPVNLVLDNEPAIELYNPDELELETTYFWRVDCENEAGTLPGDVWSFTTGVNTLIDMTSSIKNLVEIFPNPAKDNIVIRSDHKILSVQLFNSYGYLLFTSEQNDFSISLNVSDLTEGIYFVKYRTGLGYYVEQLLIK